MIFVYKTTNIINGKIYIGVHKTDILEDGYIGSGKDLNEDVEVLGISCFKREIIKYFNDEQSAYIEERRLVNQKFVDRGDTYNLTVGGDGGWYHTKGKVVVKDKDGNTMQVSVDDLRYLSGELFSIHKGMVPVKDKEGITKYVSINDVNYTSGILVHNTKNKCVVKDKDGNTMQVSVDDPRYLSGELVGIAKNKVIVKDKEGNIIQVSLDDPRYLSGELFSIHKGMVVVKNIHGERFYVSNKDPKYLSGELVSISKGRRHNHKNKRKRIICPYCNKKGDITNMKRWHLENCKLKTS